MDDGHFTLEQLIAALQTLDDKWDGRLREAGDQARRLRIGDTHKSFYYRGIADGYRLALRDLRDLLTQPTPEPEIIETSAEIYAVVSGEAALAVLKQAGLSPLDLHEHKDHSFTAVFSPLQVMPFEERARRLSAAANVAVLDYGRLPNSNKTFMDFGFQTAPED